MTKLYWIFLAVLARIGANEGVPLHKSLKKAGVPQGSELCGKALASYVWEEGQDGYQVVFSATLKDEPGTRSVRKLVKIEVVQVRK